MYGFDADKINISLLKAIRLCIACRKLVKKRSPEEESLHGIEFELRQSAAEVQRVAECIKVDARMKADEVSKP